MQPVTEFEMDTPDSGDRLLSASCSLGPDEMRTRLAEWAAVRDRSESIRETPGGVVLTLGETESIAALADLVDRESDCCGFYSFTLTVDGPARELHVNAGPGRGVAVTALLGLDDASR